MPKIGKRIWLVILASCLVLAAGITAIFILQPARLIVPAERVAIYQQILGTWQELPALNVRVEAATDQNLSAKQLIHEQFISLAPDSSKADPAQPSVAWMQELADALPLALRDRTLLADTIPLSLDPLLIFKHSKSPGRNAIPWVLAGKEDLVLGLLVAWLAVPHLAEAEAVRLQKALSSLARLEEQNQFQKNAFSFPLSDAMDIFSSGKGQNIILTLSMFRTLPVPVQATMIGQAVPETKIGNSQVQFASARLRGLVFPFSPQSGTELAIAQRLARPDAQRLLSDQANELAARLDALPRDAVDDQARRMLISAQALGTMPDNNQLLANARSALIKPADFK